MSSGDQQSSISAGREQKTHFMWYGDASKENLTEQYSDEKISVLYCHRPL